jgi:hypothetical protein
MISTLIIAMLTYELLNMNLVASKEIMINEDKI